MKHNFKFRGKRCDNGEWVYGYYTPWSCINTFQLDDNGIVIQSGEYEVDPETVTQFTGLKDHTGKEIYEGDIVRFVNTEVTGKIVWQKNAYRYTLCNIHGRGCIKIIKSLMRGHGVPLKAKKHGHHMPLWYVKDMPVEVIDVINQDTKHV